jgi:prevent-host-death family protein
MIITTDNAKKDFTNLLKKVNQENESIILTQHGKQIAALISIDELNLLQQIEDYIDIQDAKKALRGNEENISSTEFWKQLGL